MTPIHPGNERDPGDMSGEPDAEPDLPEEDAEKLGDFA